MVCLGAVIIGQTKHRGKYDEDLTNQKNGDFTRHEDPSKTKKDLTCLVEGRDPTGGHHLEQDSMGFKWY